MNDEQKQALAKYIANVLTRYGERIIDIVVFGSRARGDNENDSDLDLAIVLEDGAWDVWSETSWLAGKTFWPLVQSGLFIQPVPVRLTEWLNPERHTNATFIRNVQRDARRVEEAA